MKSLKQISGLFLLALWGLGFLMTACSKSDSLYYNYVNNVQTFDGDALQYLEGQPKGTFDSLLVVLSRLPHLQDSLKVRKVTLFAPVNENFEAAIKYLNMSRKAQDKAALNLNNMDIAQLDTMACKYIVRGVKIAEDYESSSDGLLLETISFNYPMHIRYEKVSSSGYVSGGASTLNFSDPFGSSFSQDWITTKANTVNIKTNNAIINILTPTHNFGFDEFTSRLDN